jgi:hypothetical protein
LFCFVTRTRQADSGFSVSAEAWGGACRFLDPVVAATAYEGNRHAVLASVVANQGSIFFRKGATFGVLWVCARFGGDLALRRGVWEGSVGDGIEVAGADDLKAWG